MRICRPAQIFSLTVFHDYASRSLMDSLNHRVHAGEIESKQTIVFCFWASLPWVLELLVTSLHVFIVWRLFADA